FGSNSPLTLGDRPVAAKTGTTQDFRDGWTMGFTPSLAAGVWTGNNNNVSMKRDAVLVAGPIWNKFMREALKDTPIEQFERPEGIKEVTVDSISGKLPTQYTPSTKVEIFADYAVPTVYDDVHVPVRIDSLTGFAATELTPPDQITTEIYTVLHSEKRDNPAWERPVIAWALANGYKYPPGSGIGQPEPGQGGDISFTSPTSNATITKIPYTVSLNVSGENIVRVDVSVDGSFVGDLTSSPYTIAIDEEGDDGKHIISAKAVYGDGRTSTTSISVTYNLKGGESTADDTLEIVEPTRGSNISFPLELIAESTTSYGSVTFYYQSGGQTKTIGTASKLRSGDNYQYTTTWSNPPKSGTYRVYARSDSDITSNRISVEID
ncbi:MAG: hypothetical protein M3Q64_03185, partial [bacterium]|nr:hypothetical protein [bacterium]